MANAQTMSQAVPLYVIACADDDEELAQNQLAARFNSDAELQFTKFQCEQQVVVSPVKEYNILIANGFIAGKSYFTKAV